jgi:DNA primase
MKDREIVERVKDATDLVALVGHAVKLRQQGSAWSGLCPFHSERSPSFQVVPARGFYHCFGCGKHGDCFSWLMEREGLSFPEALEQLARAAGVELPKFRERPAAEVDLESRLRATLETAQQFYERNLNQHEEARRYLKDRGFEGAFVQEAGFGVAPDAWDRLIEHLRRLDVSPDLLEQSGLASRSERGSQIDFLRNRLTIPIHDARGRLVAFGGRVFGDEKPKYLNTRETALFKKGETLFGFHRAKGALREGVMVVEGYFDVLQLHQQGITQAVAPLGTALTEDHLKQIQRFTKRVILCFDGDAAGQRAMEKSLRLALPLGFDIRLLELPQGEDPDTWCLRLGAEAFRELMRQAPDWTSFVIDRALEGKDLRRLSDRMAAFKDLAEFLPYLPRTLETRELIASLSHQLQIPMNEIDRAMKSKRSTPNAELPEGSFETQAQELDEAIRQLILLARSGDRLSIQGISPAWWENLSGAPLLQLLLDAEGDEDSLPKEVLAQIRGLEAQVSRRDEISGLSGVESLFNKLESNYVERERQALQRQLQEPRVLADKELMSRLEARLSELLARKSQLARQLRTSR